MTQEIATTSNNEQELTKNDYAQQRQKDVSGQKVLDFLDNYALSWGKAANIAEQLARTDYAGQFKGKPADLAAAILQAATVGIPPEQVGKSIYVVHGAPTLYGEAALALALDAGYTHEKTKYSPEVVALTFYRPDGTPYEVEYTFERAEREGLVAGNKQQYTKRPEKMLFWKCVGEAADQLFPHITKGMGVKEDYEQSNPNEFKKTYSATATRRQPQQARGLSAIAAATNTAPQEEPVDAEVDGDEVELLQFVRQSLEECDNADEVNDFASKLKAEGEVPENVQQMVTTRWNELQENN